MGDIKKVESELREGMGLAKCRKCDCMKITLKSLRTSLSSNPTENSSVLVNNIERWLTQMEPIKYDCLGCQHCYPAVAWNLMETKTGSTNQQDSSSCNQDKKK